MELDKINSENYESFYLDYLEGNLMENDTLELFAFLNEHPEFQVDDELIVLESAEPKLGNDFKNLLKTDIYSQAISLNNIDLFLIAEKEGQLNNDQLAQLNSFLDQNPALKNEQKLYAATTLQADQTLVYADKAAIKQKGKVILWPYFSAAAAACAVMLLWLLPNTNSKLDAVSAAQDLEYKIRQVRQKVNPETENNFVPDQKAQPKSFQAFQVNKSPIKETPIKLEIAINPKEKLPEEKNDKTPKLKSFDEQPATNIGIALIPEAKNSDKNNTATAMNSGYGLTMKDVAPPVTRKLSEMIKTEVNLKKGVDASGTREGVFFKLGKFEYYRNKKKKQ